MKTECIRKSLMSDFKNVGICTGIVLGTLIALYLIGSAVIYLFNIIESIKLVMGAYEAFIIFGIFAIVIGFIMNLVTPKKHLVESGTAPNYFVGVMFVLALYGCYCINSWSIHFVGEPWNPDVNLIFVIFILAGIVLTPFALVYVRCKEKVVND
jgi:hypothetical protein